MPKVTYIGAGSAVFARQVVTDILCTEGLDTGTFALVDIDQQRLDLAEQVVRKLVDQSGKAWKVEASTERQDLLDGSDFVINSIEVAGLANVRSDYEIPLRYGVDQCIGDTIGPGGIFKALRTGPAWLGIVRDVEEAAPDAVVLNYTNPMSILTLAASRVTNLTVLGLCHSVQGTSRKIADYLDIPYEEMDWDCAGINHNAWFTRLERGGEDLYPSLRERADDPEVYEQDPVRFEVMKHLGAFVTESSGHFSEYVPYFRSRPDLIEKFCRPGYLGGSGFYADNWPKWQVTYADKTKEFVESDEPAEMKRSVEYASYIVEARTLGERAVVYANVVNEGLIDNLAPGGCVEVACEIDTGTVRPLHFGELPEQLAALNRTHMAVHELTVKALLEGDKESARHALMLDPLSSAVCSLDEISAMFDEMWAAQSPPLAL